MAPTRRAAVHADKLPIHHDDTTYDPVPGQPAQLAGAKPRRRPDHTMDRPPGRHGVGDGLDLLSGQWHHLCGLDARQPHPGRATLDQAVLLGEGED